MTETEPQFVLARAKESGRLWVYPIGLWEEMLRRNYDGFDEVIRSSDAELLKQMAALTKEKMYGE